MSFVTSSYRGNKFDCESEKFRFFLFNSIKLSWGHQLNEISVYLIKKNNNSTEVTH